MCGICGKLYHDVAQHIEKHEIASMTRCATHRGPDEEGIYIKGHCGLGHRRLSIIDLSSGQQPLSNEDGSCWIVFNGEIYNFHELRDDLITRGHVFKTRSDTETILHLYEEQGERCVESLRGMFAFAIWNERRRELLLARDRIGKKPLFYTTTAEAFLFASELKSLLTDPAVDRQVNLEAIDQYFTLQYVPAPETIFAGIHKLPPAHTLLWREGKSSLRCYWSLTYEPKSDLTEAEACDRLRFELDEAVRIRLESEVPLGCLLSGGIDSSAVVAFTRRHIAGPLRTFSIGFEEESHNELPYAKMIAEQFETRHEEFIVRPNAIEVLPHLVWHCDEPFADASALPTWYVSEITRRQVTVALNGDGGDESFAGYTRYCGLPIIHRYERVPKCLRQTLVRPLARSLQALFPKWDKPEKLNFLNDFSLASPGEQYANYMIIFRRAQRARLYADGLRDAVSARDPMDYLLNHYDRQGLLADVDRKLNCDVLAYLPGDLLVKMDRMSMAHSLEARSPFLDHKLMEFAATLPGALKLQGGELKYILKKALEPILPHEILYRPKQGFGVPLHAWFRNELHGMTHDLLLSDQAVRRGFFKPAYVRQLISEHVSGRQNHHHRLWALLCFEIWCRTYLDRPNPAEGSIRL